MHHKKGYGSFLLRYRLNQIKIVCSNWEIYLHESQHVYRFFLKYGFYVKQIQKNGYGDNLDKYEMIFMDQTKGNTC